MTADRNLDRELGSWFAEQASSVPAETLLQRGLERVAATRQRPGWLVGGVALPRPFAAPAIVPAWVVILLIALAAAAVVATGARLLLAPSLAIVETSPIPSTFVEPSAAPSPTSTATPSGPLGGGPILAHEFKRISDPDPHGVFAIDAGTGARTLLGTLPGEAVTGSSNPYTFQFSADRTHVLILGGSLQAPTAVSRAFGFIASADLDQSCCKDGMEWITLSPRGDRVAAIHVSRFDATIEIVILDIAGGGISRLPLPAGIGWGGPLAWSPDEAALVVPGCRPCNKAATPTEKQTSDHSHIYVVPVDGSPWRELLDVDNGAAIGAVAPDGKTLAVDTFICASGSYMPRCDPSEGTHTLSTLSLADGVQTPLGVVPSLTGIAWSPDGTRIAYGAKDGIHVMNADGSGTVKLGDGVGYGADWSPDGQWLLLRRDGFDLWIASADGSDLRQIGTGYAGGTW